MLSRLVLLTLLCSCGIEERDPDFVTQYGIDIYINDNAVVNIERIDAATQGTLDGTQWIYGNDALELVKRSFNKAVLIIAENKEQIACGDKENVVGCAVAHRITYAARATEEEVVSCREIIVGHELSHVVATVLAQQDIDHTNTDLFGEPFSVSWFAINKVYDLCYR